MDDAALSTLKAAFDAATSWNEWATAVVVIGVAVEFLALLLFSKEMSRAEKLMLVLGSLLVVGGVGGEYVFGSRATRIATELQQHSDQTIAGLTAQQEADHKIATQAAAHAADLGVTVDNLKETVRQRTADADTAIVSLNDAAKRLNEKIADLATKQADRRLTDEQKRTLIAALSPFHGQKVVIWTILGNSECKRFLEDFTEIFDKIGWDYDHGNRVFYGNYASDPVGVAIAVNKTLKDQHKVLSVVTPLTETLASFGLVPPKTVSPTDEVRPEEVGLVIGRKP